MTEAQESYTTDESPCTTVGSEKPIEGRCNARTRGGGDCQNYATEHGRCRMHGGANGTGRPPTHGLYSEVLRKGLQDKYRAFLGDPAYTSVAKELALARALLADYAGRFVDGVALPAEDIERLTNLIDKIGKLAERTSRIEARTALTARELDLLGVVIIREPTAELDRERARDVWDRIVAGVFGFRLPEPGHIIGGRLVDENDASW
jgi:hypothetical protein